MKKFVVSWMFALAIVGSVIAQSIPKNKIGAYLGLPLGVSYSHQVSDLVELDFLGAFDIADLKYDIKFENQYGEGWENGDVLGVGLTIRFAPLFRAWEGMLGKFASKFSLGPAFGVSVVKDTMIFPNLGTFGGFNISLPLRFEMNFTDAFNFFAELVPVGVSASFKKFSDEYGNASAKSAHYYARGGIGLRYSF